MSRAWSAEDSRLRDPLSSQSGHKLHIPNSPPLSTSASPPAPPSPQHSAYTPPASVSMSTQPSQSSYSTSPTLKTDTLPTTQQDTLSQLSTSSTNKRKLSADEGGRSSSKRARTDDNASPARAPSLYKLNSQPHPPSLPHGSQNLLETYDLREIAASVARTNEAGEKINKIRKSYEGYLKNNLMGKNKSTTKDGDLLQFFGWPEHEWSVQKVEGHDLMDGLTSKMLQNLDRATQMQRVEMPTEEQQEWGRLLEHGEYAPKPPTAVPQPDLLQPGAASRQPGVAYKSASTPSQDPARSSLRRGTKRSYKDDSFVGYNESSFVEDLDDDSMMDDDDNRKRRKRKVRSPMKSVGSVP